MMQVIVPAGVLPGQMMNVQMADQQLVQVQVPPGLLAGQSFQIQAPTPPQMLTLEVTVPAGVSPGQMMQVQGPNGPLQVQVPAGVLAGGKINIQVPAGGGLVAQAPMSAEAAAAAAEAAAVAAGAAAGVAEVQRVLLPRDLPKRAARLQHYLTTVPAPLLKRGPALAHAIRRCSRAPLGRSADA